jgi:hypothetical protein
MRFELICEDYYPEEHDLHCPGQLYEAGRDHDRVRHGRP